jgi:hypothetical protein
VFWLLFTYFLVFAFVSGFFHRQMGDWAAVMGLIVVGGLLIAQPWELPRLVEEYATAWFQALKAFILSL